MVTTIPQTPHSKTPNYPNRLLSLSPPVPFEFVVEGQLLRSTLRKQIRQQGLSEVHCAPAPRSARPPKLRATPDRTRVLPVPAAPLTALAPPSRRLAGNGRKSC